LHERKRPTRPSYCYQVIFLVTVNEEVEFVVAEEFNFRVAAPPNLPTSGYNKNQLIASYFYYLSKESFCSKIIPFALVV
jgi:hypothetical protein